MGMYAKVSCYDIFPPGGNMTGGNFLVGPSHCFV